MQTAGQTWIIVTVLHPLNQRVSCEGEFEGGVPFKNLVRIASMVQGKGDIRDGEYYGVGMQDCVCEGDFGYTTFLRDATPVVYCLSPLEAEVVQKVKTRSSERSR